jgi:hypothetical protein
MEMKLLPYIGLNLALCLGVGGVSSVEKNKKEVFMKTFKRIIVAAALLGGLVPLSAWAGAWEDSGLWLDNGVPVVNTPENKLDIYGRAQMIGTGEIVPDPKAAHERVYLFLNEARLGLKGQYEDLFKYEMQLDFGGESINGSNTNMSLLDMVADIPTRPLGENAIFKIGQFRVPYSREALTDDGFTDFTDPSIANAAASQGRDYGLALMDTFGNIRGTIGTFTGGGRNVPQRYLPEQIGVPYMVARVGYDDGADVDIYHVVGHQVDMKRDSKAFYVNAIYMQDTRIGHSTALGVHTIDDNLLIDPNYNPYLKWGDTTDATGAVCSAITCERGHIFLLGTDGVVRHRIDDKHSLELEYEGNWGGYWNQFGVIHIASARAQAQYTTGKFDFALRYAVLSMGDNSGFLVGSAAAAAQNPAYSTQVGGTAKSGAFVYNEQMGEPIHEITPSVTYRFKNDCMKVVASVPLFLNAPLWIDNADGTYVFTDPTPSGATTLTNDQGSVLQTAGNSTERRFIPEARVMFQFQF